MKYLLLLLLISPCHAQWKAIGISKPDNITAINENFSRASYYSNRKLDKFSNDVVYGLPTFNQGIVFNDATIQTTAFSSSTAYAVLNATQTFTGIDTFIKTIVGSITGSASTVTGAAQTAITSVGTLSGLTVSGNTLFPGSGIWNTSGNVGIGTTNPLTIFDVLTTTTNPFILLDSYNNTLGDSHGIRFGTGNGTTYQKGGIFYKRTSQPDARGELHFALQGDGTSANATIADSKMVIQYGGNVGIGVINPTSMLYVSSWTSSLGYIDRTDYPETKEIAYAAVLSMGRKTTGRGVNHAKLSDFVRHDAKREVYNKITKSTDTIIVEQGRNLTASVSAQNEVIKDLISRIAELEKQVNNLILEKLAP